MLQNETRLRAMSMMYLVIIKRIAHSAHAMAPTELKSGVSNIRPAGRMWPTRVFRAARDVFWEF